MHPVFARQTPAEPAPSESPIVGEPGTEPPGEPSSSTPPQPASSETQPPASESTPPPSESGTGTPPPLSSSTELSASSSNRPEEPLASPTPSEILPTSPSPTTQLSATLTPPITNSLTESVENSASFTTVTTTINGRATTYVTPIAEANGARNDSRIGLIAGLTVGLIALLLLILSAVFLYRRHRLRRKIEVQTAEKKRKEGRSLLDGEGFEEDDHDLAEVGSRGVVAMRSYDSVNQQTRSGPLRSTPYGTHYTQRSASPTFSILRSRASESGSIFREDVWPPPTEGLIDPITKESSQVDLSRVVDDVMGPSSSQPHTRQGTHTSVDSMSPLILNHDSDFTHSRGQSVDSQYMDPLQPFSFVSSSFPKPQTTSYPSLAGAAALASFPPPVQAAASSSTSQIQFSPDKGLPLVPLPPATMAMTSSSVYRRPPSPIPFVTSPTTTTTFGTPFPAGNVPPPPGAATVHPSSLQQRSTPPISIIPVSTKRSSVPKKSSPLARRLSQDALTWLSRGVPSSGGSQSKHS